MPNVAPSVLLIGYGNPGRGDDGVGPMLAEAVEREAIDGVTVQAAFQLQPEDSVAVGEHDVVVFVDADTSCPEPFRFQRVVPRIDLNFTSHCVLPEALLGMAHDLLGARTDGYVLGIRGRDFESLEGRLSDAAQRHLDRAREFILPVLRDRSFDRHADEPYHAYHAYRAYPEE